MKLNLLLGLFIFCLFSCVQGEKQNDSENSNPHHSALPDSDVTMETELSEVDKRKLANAKGKEASPVSMEKLNATLENLESKVALCYFWNESNEKTEKLLKSLDKISDQLDAEELSIFLICTEIAPDVNRINGIVRASGIDAEIFLLENEKIFGDITGDSGKWSGLFPAYYMYQPKEKSGTWLAGEKDSSELYAMLQTFVF